MKITNNQMASNTYKMAMKKPQQTDNKEAKLQQNQINTKKQKVDIKKNNKINSQKKIDAQKQKINTKKIQNQKINQQKIANKTKHQANPMVMDQIKQKTPVTYNKQGKVKQIEQKTGTSIDVTV